MHMDAGDAAQVGAAGPPLAGLPCHLHLLCCWYALHILLLPLAVALHICCPAFECYSAHPAPAFGCCPSRSLPVAFEQLSPRGS